MEFGYGSWLELCTIGTTYLENMLAVGTLSAESDQYSKQSCAVSKEFWMFFG